jgi:glycosyltransferase involved in cell wall biosynthesis
VRLLIATDSFPPNCGGSGWSTYELARGLRARGHRIDVIRPRPGARGGVDHEYDGFLVDEIAMTAPNVPFVRNYFKNERLWVELARVLDARLASQEYDLVHAQHVLTTVPAIRAGRARRVPVVATVRDYWPVCYWSDLIIDPDADALCPACTVSNMTHCIRPRGGAAWPLALPMIPYMRANLARKRSALAGANAIIAVSRAIAQDLAARAPELTNTRVEQIPNPVDIAAIQQIADAAAAPSIGRYVLYCGKLEINKGADLIVPVAKAARLACPLVIVGDGRLRGAIEADAREAGIELQMLGWQPRPQALAWMRHAAALVFPSRGPESLSRVLLEASALGVPTAAMNTGGTEDIIEHERTGLLSSTSQGLAADLARLLGDQALALRLGDAARAHVTRTFDSQVVVSRIEALYEDLIRRQQSERDRG